MSELNEENFKYIQNLGKSLERNRILKLLSQKLARNEELTHSEIIELIVATTPKTQTGRGHK